MSEKDEDSVKEKWGGGQGGTRRNQKKAERLHRKKEQLKLTALDNRTHFKTGWEVKETEKERKKTYAVHVSDGESYMNEEYLDRLPECERMEIEWRKTQRRISESYVFVVKDEIVRYRQPHRKLRPIDHPRERGPLVRLDAPVPHFSTDAIPDSGVRKELDLICLEDDLYLAAIDFDIQGVQNRHFLSLGPSAAKWVREYCAKKRHAKKSLTYTTERYPDGGIHCDLASTSTDLFGRSQVYYPDADNYKGAEKEFRSRIQYFAANELSSRLMNLRETTSNFMCSLSAGLKPTIHMRDDEYNFSRVFCIPIVDRAGLVNGLKNSFPSFLGVREITARERAYARWKSEELGIAKCLLDMGGAAFEVAFGSSHEGLSFCQRYCSKTDVFKVIMKYPTGLDNCTKTDFFSLVLKWHPYASKMRVDVYLKKPEDLGFAEQILCGHGIPCRIPEKDKYTPGNRRMEIRWVKGFSNMAYDSVISERVLRDVLVANGIELDRILLHRRKRPPLDDHHIMDLIDQRIGRAAVNAKVWTDDYVPTVDMEWFAYIHNKAQLGWMVELPPDETTEDQGRDYERKAIVTFHDEDYGRAVAEYLQARSADSTVLTLAECDEQGVRFYPIHTVLFACPKALRALCNDALNAIDDLDREQSDYASRRWVRLRDYKHEDILVVEGWPKDHADQTVEKVRAILRGRVVSCADDGTDSSPARLLYGCGLQHVNNLQKTHEEKVIMALDRLNQEITMWGDEDTMDIIRVELDSYVKNRAAYMVNASIIIDTPRFLPIFSEILVFNTNKRIGEAVGGATTRFRYPNRLEFSGSVQQYEDLQQLLDNTHAKALEVVRNIGHSGDVSQLFLTDCPVCLLPAVGPYILELCGHRYCLQCIAEMIRVNVRNRQLPIKCCAEACGEVIALGDILGLLFDENSIGYPQLFMERLQPIFTSCSERGAFDRKNMKFCARLGCSTIIRLMGGIESYDCPRCEMQMCAGCWNPPHAGRSCADELRLRGSAELSVNEWSAGQEGRVKRCPTANCRAVILKEEGCNHMQCSMCKVHFCWLCSFTADIDKEIYAHMVAIHGGTGGGYDFLDHLGEPDAFDAPPGFEHMEPVEW